MALPQQVKALASKVRVLVNKWQREGKIPRGTWRVTGNEQAEADAARLRYSQPWVNVQPIDLPGVRLYNHQAFYVKGFPNAVRRADRVVTYSHAWWALKDALEALLNELALQALTPGPRFVRILDPDAYFGHEHGPQADRERALAYHEMNLIKAAYPYRAASLLFEAPDEVLNEALARARRSLPGGMLTFDPREYGWGGWYPTSHGGTDFEHYEKEFRNGAEGWIFVKKKSLVAYNVTAALRELFQERRFKDEAGNAVPLIPHRPGADWTPLIQNPWLEFLEKTILSNGRVIWLVKLYRPRVNRYDILEGGFASSLEDAVQKAGDAGGEPVLLRSEAGEGDY
jgi:hypothetical protein